MSVVFGNWGSAIKRRKISSNVKMYADATNLMYAAAQVEQPMMVPTPVEAESMLVEAMKRVVRALEPFQTGPDVLTGDIFSSSTSMLQKRLQMHDVLLSGLAGAAKYAKPAKKRRLLTELEQAKRMGVAYITYSKMTQLATSIDAPVPTVPLDTTPPETGEGEASGDAEGTADDVTVGKPGTDDTADVEVDETATDPEVKKDDASGSKEETVEDLKDKALKDVPKQVDELEAEVKGKAIFVMNDGKVAPLMGQLNFLVSQLRMGLAMKDLRKLFDVDQKIHIFEGDNNALEKVMALSVQNILYRLYVHRDTLGESQFKELLPKEVPFATPSSTEEEADPPKEPSATEEQVDPTKNPSPADVITQDDPAPSQAEAADQSQVQAQPSKNPKMPTDLTEYTGSTNVTQSKFVIQNKDEKFVLMKQNNFMTRKIKGQPAPIGPLYETGEQMLSNDAVYIKIGKVNYKVDGYEEKFKDVFNKFF